MRSDFLACAQKSRRAWKLFFFSCLHALPPSLRSCRRSNSGLWKSFCFPADSCRELTMMESFTFGDLIKPALWCTVCWHWWNHFIVFFFPCRPLQRMCAGMLLAACSFVMAAFIQIAIQVSWTLLFWFCFGLSKLIQLCTLPFGFLNYSFWYLFIYFNSWNLEISRNLLKSYPLSRRVSLYSLHRGYQPSTPPPPAPVPNNGCKRRPCSIFDLLWE